MGSLALSLLLGSSFLFAQANFGTISGVIEDASHAPATGVQITLKAEETGAVRNLISNAEGGIQSTSPECKPWTLRWRELSPSPNGFTSIFG